MNNQAKYNTLIIDDETPARIGIKAKLKRFPMIFRVTEEAANGIEALEKINQLQPDLIFLDIEMPGLNGFEVLEQITHNPIVIFCTAYDHYAVKAFETWGIDYLLKPVTEERLKITVDKLQNADPEFLRAQVKKYLLQAGANSRKAPEKTSLTVQIGKRIHFLSLAEITFFKARDKYVNIHTSKGETYLHSESLSKLQEDLPDHFMRIKRSLLINRSLVKEVYTHFNSRYRFVMNDSDKTTLVSGRSYKEEIEKAMMDR